MNQRIRVAVIGCGSMGQNHIRIFSQMKNVDLIGIYDLNTEAATKVASEYSCKTFLALEGIESEVDAVSICTPSTTHHDVASYFMNEKIHCLVEKPLATSEGDAENLVKLSKKNRVKLLVGHVEQFNPAVIQLREILNNGEFKINTVKTSRTGVGGARITDVGVIEDIMIHDLDVVLSIVGEIPSEIYSGGINKVPNTPEDLCVAMLKFPSGIIADLTASRITHKRTRTLEIDTDKGVFVLDYFTQELEFHHHRQDTLEQDPLSKLGTAVMDTRIEKILLRRAEPLITELNHFIEMISEDVAAVVSGSQALTSLLVAWKIKENLT